MTSSPSLGWGGSGSFLSVALVDSTSTYIPADTDHDFNDFVAGGGVECGPGSGTAYARQSPNLTDPVADNPGHRVLLRSDPVVFPGLDGLTIKAVLFLDEDVSPELLIAYYDTADFPIVASGGDVTIRFDPNDGAIVIA